MDTIAIKFQGREELCWFFFSQCYICVLGKKCAFRNPERKTYSTRDEGVEDYIYQNFTICAAI